MPNDPYGDLIATPSTAAAPDPYKNLMGPSTAPLRASLTLAADQNTDEFAKARQLARRLGHPEEAVRALPEEAKRQDLIQQVETDTAQAPVLRNSFLQNDFAVLAKGDTPALTKLEQGLRKFFDGGAYKQEAAYAAKVAGATAARALGGATVGVGATVFDAEAVAFDWLSGLTKGILPVDIPGQIAASARGSASAARGSLDFFLPKATNNLEAGLYSGGQSLGFNLATLPLAMEAAAVRGPEMAGHVMGLVAALATGAQTYNQGRDAGMGQIGATTFAAPAAMAEYLFEKWSGGKFFDDIAAKSGALKMLFNTATREVIGENATTLTQNFNEWLRLNPEKTVRDFVSEQPDAMIQTTIAALVGAGGMTGAVKLMQQFGDISVKQEDALHQHALLQGIMQTAAGSKLRELDPDTFSRFVQDAANGTEGAPKSMFVDGNTLAEVLNQAGVTEDQLAQALPSVSSQLADAVSMGSAVEIPMGELATALPGTPLEQALLPHLRTSEDAPSQMEAQQAQANAQEFLQTSAQRVIDQAADGVKAAASAEAVRKTMFDQLMATGRMSEDVASKNATLVREWYTVMSSMMGTTPEELYKAMPYTVQGAGQRGALTQERAAVTDTPEFKAWFGDSKVVDAEGKPLVVYHGTDRNIEVFSKSTSGKNVNHPATKAGFFFTENKAVANNYAVGADLKSYSAGDESGVQQLIPAYLALTNPLVLDVKSADEGDDVLAKTDLSSYDGAVFRIRGEGGASANYYVAFSPTQIKSATGNNGNFDGTDPNILRQSELVAQHNLTAENLLHAVKMGGIPVPSLAVTDKAHPLTNFGEITLLAPRDMVDPKGYAGAKVFGADIYSPRYPQINYELTPAKMKPLIAEFQAGEKATGMRIQWDEVQSRGPEELANSPAVMWQFLTGQGITPDVTYEPAFDAARRERLRDFGFEKFFGNTDHQSLVRDDEFQRLVIAAQNVGYELAGMPDQVIDFDATKSSDFSRIMALSRNTAYDMGKINRQTEPDGYATRNSLRAQIRGKLDEAFKSYVKGKFSALGAKERIFQGFTNSGNKKYIPHTLENVVKILKKELRGGENFNYGVGSLRAKFTPQFKSIEQIRKAKGRLMDAAAFGKVKTEIDNELVSIAEELGLSLGQTIEVMEDATKMGAGRAIERALVDYAKSDAPASDEAKAHVAEFLTRLRNLPTEYFEAKILREVDLAEFEGAVVPSGVDPEVIKVLNARGITDILTYKAGDMQDRADKIRSFSHLLFQNTQPNKYQQKYLAGRGVAGLTEEERTQYDALATPADLQQPQAQGPRGTFNPATLTTVLNENADLSTFLHETGHFFHEALMQLASQPDAPQEVKDLAAKALKVFGVKDIETWNAMDLEAKRPHYERFAETFELYLMTGKAPNVEIAGLFRTFRAWLTRVYKSLESFAQSKGITLDKDLTDVMDRMLATEAQIAEAEKVAGMVPELNATGEAIEQLQARSIRDLKWAVNARDKMIKALQKEAATKRKEVEEEVTAEVDATPEMRAKKALDALRVDPDYTVALKTWNDQRAEQLKQNQETLESELRAANPDVKGLAKGQLMVKNKRQIAANAELRTLEWEKQNPKPRRPVNTTDADVATVADSFGYESPEAMVQAIDAYGPRDVAIEGIADQRMLERYGDLTDPAAIAAAATEAVHNQARAKSLATELAAQREMLNKRDDTGKTNAKGQKVTVNALMEAAKQFAANVIGRRQIGDLKKAANSHLQAERRAAKAWEAATAKGDTQAAVQAKQDQVLNNAAVRAAQDAQAEVKKTMEFFAKVTKGNSETVVEKGRDLDVVNAARAILAVYGIAPFKGKNAFEYMSLVQANDPQMFAVLDASVKAAVASAKPIGQMTVDELSALRDEIDSMWHLAKASREYEVDGNKMDIADAGEELKNRMVAKGIPDRIPGEGHAVTESERAGRSLQFAGALLRRVEQWAEGMDGKFGGPFLRLVFQPVKEAANRYRTDRVAYREAFTKLVENLSPAIKPGLIEAPEIGYTFGKGKGTAGAAELTHAILHLGNESNKRKLLLGRQWATENPDGTLNTDKWDAFIKRMHDTGVITKVHYDFAQGVWDLLEKMKPLAQKTHRDVFGRYFAEVTADVLSTPFGDYRGGYVPAQVDPEIVKDNEIRKLAEMENENMSYAFPSTNKGFTKSRTEYNRPLLLDIRALGQHMDKVLLFSHMEPAVRGVSKVLQEKGVAYSMNRIDPSAVSGMLTPWLNRSARQVVETPVVGDGRISRVLSVVRARAGMSVMFANVSNTLQQVAGLALAGVKVKPSHLASAMATYVASPKKTSEAVAKASEFMAHRMDDQIGALNGTMEEILLNPSAYESAQAWTQKHAYFLQSALDNVIGPVVWTGAYNQAIEQGMEEKDAVRFADGTIRQTQGSTLAEDISRIETGPAYARVFTQFIGYFNMVANTNATALQNIADDVGLKKGAGKALAVVFMGLLAPAWIAEAIAVAMKGGPDDDNKDGSYLAEWLMSVFGMGTLKTLLAGVPFVGQFAMAGVNTWNDKPYDDRTNLSPAVSMLEGSVGAPRSVYKALVDNGSKQKAVRDVATAVSLATGLPASAIARPLGYLAGTADHKINPTSGADEARGLITGTASPQSKQQ